MVSRGNRGSCGRIVAIALSVAISATVAACGGSGGSGLPAPNSLGLPVVGGSPSLPIAAPATVTDLLNQLAALAAGLTPAGSGVPTLGQLTGSLPTGGTLGGLPVLGAVQGAAGGVLSNVSLTNPTVPPNLSTLLGALPVSQLNSVPVLGAIVEGQGGTLSGVIAVLQAPTIPGGTPTLLGVLAVVTQANPTAGELIGLAQSLAPGAPGLNIDAIIGQLAGAPPASLTGLLPSSLLATVEGLLHSLLG